MPSSIKKGKDRPSLPQGVKPAHAIVAAELMGGATKKEALLSAGYAESTADKSAKKVIDSEGVQRALAAMGERITTKELGEIGKAKLMQVLCDPELPTRETGQFVRTALEVAGHVGPARDQKHLHTIVIPDAAQELIAAKVVERMRKEAQTVEGEIVNG